MGLDPTQVMGELIRMADSLEPLDSAAGEVPQAKLALVETRKVLDDSYKLLFHLEYSEMESKKLLDQYEDAMQDTWDSLAKDRADWAVRSNLAPTERFAQYKLDNIANTRRYRKQRDNHRSLELVVKQARTLVRAIDGRRTDLHSIIRAHGFEFSLER